MKLIAALAFATIFSGIAHAAGITTEAQTLTSQYVDAFNHKDASKTASFYTEDGVAVAQTGATVSGRSNLANLYSKIVGHFVLAITLDQVHSQGSGGWALAHGTQTFPDGHVVKTHAIMIYQRENGELKVRALSFGTNVSLPS